MKQGNTEADLFVFATIMSRCPKCFLQLFIPFLHVFATPSAYHTLKPEQGRISFGKLNPNIHVEAGGRIRNQELGTRAEEVGIGHVKIVLFVPFVFWCASSFEDSHKICSEIKSVLPCKNQEARLSLPLSIQNL